MKEQHPTPSDSPGLDFDGEYGRTYRRSIRNSVPGYDALIEISAAALEQAVPQASLILVVGPGLGEELVPLFTALPQTRFTLLEPSTQMREACSREIAAAGAAARCELLAQSLEAGVDPPGGPLDAVVCKNVLHLMPPERQRGLPETLIDQLTASRNTLVFSLDQTQLEAGLAAAGMEPPLLLQQSLFSRLWLSRRPA